MSFKLKQVIVVRSDLKLSKGKLAVQVAHAAVEAAELAKRRKRAWWRAWKEEGACKIAVKAPSEADLLKLEEEVVRSGLPAVLIRNRGLTELPPNTLTCLGIGPAPVELLDKLTRKLPLL
jgi:PTH2 family peptidyl-tRNA hydrolase